jgi:rfaE bifunctional protein nucleotidyltransferase chain/domain
VTGRYIPDHEELLREVQALRAEGKTVVFTNGCFDLIHVGHVRYLRGAMLEGDVLLVALNDDESIRRNKGEGRPVQPVEERAEIVCALEGVALVTSFSDPTVDRLLTLLTPDVHAKGTDYTVETVPERETVLAYGGRIAIVGDPKDHSSTSLLRAIRGGQQPSPGHPGRG